MLTLQKKIQIENEFLHDLRLLTIEKDNWMENCEKLATSQHQLERDLEKSLKDAKQEVWFYIQGMLNIQVVLNIHDVFKYSRGVEYAWGV